MWDLSGKVALVTGGSRGIGAAVSRRLAQGGADVALTYRRAASEAEAVLREIQAPGRRGCVHQVDTADAAAVQHLVEAVVAQFGHLDILVNNAGIFPSGPLDDVTVEESTARSPCTSARCSWPHRPPPGTWVRTDASSRSARAWPSVCRISRPSSRRPGPEGGASPEATT